jgi:hypothetical protein
LAWSLLLQHSPAAGEQSGLLYITGCTNRHMRLLHRHGPPMLHT